MMRPTPATWFEIVAAKDDATRLFEDLANAGCAEFETAGAVMAGAARAESLRQRFEELQRRYRGDWPLVDAPAVPHAFPEAVLESALARLEHWSEAAEPLLRERDELRSELQGLRRWQNLLAASGIGAEECAVLLNPGRLAAAVYCSAQAATVTPPEALMLRPIAMTDEFCVLALGTPAALAEFSERCAGVGSHRIEPVAELAATDPDAALESRAAVCLARQAEIDDALTGLATEHEIAGAVADARQGWWCLTNVASVRTRQALCTVTGWTGDAAALARTVDASGAPALVRFGQPPPGLKPPMLLHNPWWVSPYEVFSRLVGMPDRNAADPSMVVAIAFPLLFGYMFGDVGQGLLLVCFGLVFGKRWPLARLFIPGGIAATGFGLLFGSAFSVHGLFAPWWLDPLGDPLRILLAPLAGGALLLLVGLGLAATEARWRGELGEWLRCDGAAAAFLLAIAAGAILSAEGYFAAAGILVAAAIMELRAGGRPGAAAAGLAEIAEKAVQLAINTLSFVRVGAFAIAHAGLSAALGMLATDAGSAGIVVLVLGNVFIVALEVLVVSIQTTRLLLFEFFIRFFSGAGRAFHPAPLPPSGSQGASP
ncbi:MAG: hypothetical protein D4R84_09520 [Rhodocyclaceae bacterium]|nr:MAG: hypothetical protein D4R84_09520 [Rhodocyclaceae bacterium]